MLSISKMISLESRILILTYDLETSPMYYGGIYPIETGQSLTDDLN